MCLLRKVCMTAFSCAKTSLTYHFFRLSMIHWSFVIITTKCCTTLPIEFHSLNGALDKRWMGKNLQFMEWMWMKHACQQQPLSLGGCPKKLSFWQPVIDKVQKKLDKWNRLNLSRGGRLTLCNSVVSRIPNYYMSIFLMPSKVIAVLERLMKNFLWEGKSGSKINHLVKWDFVSRPLADVVLG